MFWKRPGPGDSRGQEPERSGADIPSIDQSSSQQEEDTAELSSNPQFRPIPLHQQVPRDEGVSSIIHGGPQYSPHQSRLFGYTTSSSTATGQRPLPQSYPVGQPVILQSFSQGYSPPVQSLQSTDGASQLGNVGDFTLRSLGLTQMPSLQTQVPSLPSSQSSSPQHVSQDWGNRFSPPPVPYAQMSQTTSHPQIPGSQTLLPSMAALSLDNSPRGRSSRSPASPPGASPQSPLSDSVDDLKPLPQNLRGDPFRSAKVKTELCRFFKSPKGCIFGVKCNYAHGEQDLKFNKLMDLETAGLADVEVFRCHVCATWVVTGAW